MKKVWKYLEGVNGIILIIYTAFVFISWSFLSNDLSYKFLYYFLLIVVLSVLLCPQILRTVNRLKIRQSEALPSKGDKIKWLALFFILPFLVFLVNYIAYYPGGFNPDQIIQYGQAVTNTYTDWHPFLHTLFAFKLPLTLTGGWVGSITLFQIIIFSAVISYSLYSVLKYTNKTYALSALAFIILNPTTTNMAAYPVKDTFLAIGTLLLMTYAMHIFFSKGGWLKKPINIIAFVVLITITSLLRHNAILFTIPLLIAVFFYTTKRRGLMIVISFAVLFLGIKYPLQNALNVESPGKRQVEMLGVPMNIIGAVVTYNPDSLDDDILEFAYKVAPNDVWEDKFVLGSYNYVKWDEKTDNNIIEEYGAQKVINMMFRCIKASPGLSLTAFLSLTGVVYTFPDGYNFYNVVPYVEANDYNISAGGVPFLQNINSTYCDYCCTSVFSYLFLYVGAMHLVLITSILAKYKLNRLKDWKKILFILPVFIYNFGTMLLLTGIADATRFFYYTFLIMPVLIVMLFKENNERNIGT